MRSEESKRNIKEYTTRVILNVPNHIDKVYKDLASKRGISKSSMVIYAMSWFLDYNKSMDLMPKMIDAINNMKETE